MQKKQPTLTLTDTGDLIFPLFVVSKKDFKKKCCKKHKEGKRCKRCPGRKD